MDSTPDLQRELDEAVARVRNLTARLRAAKREAAPKCERCGQSLWSEYWSGPSFVAVTLTDKSGHRLCEACAPIFMDNHAGEVAGAWDIPDPMGS